MIIVNTPFIENKKIERYFDAISCHIVVGNNFFKDFAASFTDVFGGKSVAYQKQLSSLYDNAVSDLKTKASYIGANAIIGLSIEFDELSGQGKAMFMVTAIGTPVFIENYTEKENNTNYLTANSLHNLSMIELYKEKINNDNMSLNPDAIDFIVENNIQEALGIMTKHFKRLASYSEAGNEYNKFHLQYTRYLSGLRTFSNYQSIIL